MWYKRIKFQLFFVLELNNLPNSIKKITFDKDSKYNKELNCLPNFVELIELSWIYDRQIKKFPTQLKKIICWENYKYKKDFENFLIQTYNY